MAKRAATRTPCFSLPSGKRQTQSAIASSESTEPEPSSTTSSPGAAIRSGPASAIGAALTRTVAVSRARFSGAPLSSCTTSATS